MQQLIRTFGDLLPATAVLLVLGLLAVVVLTHRRASRRGLATALRVSIIDVLLILATIPLLYLAFVPASYQSPHPVNLVPGADLRTLLAGGTAGEAAAWQAAGNFVMLAPLGALVPTRFTRARSLAKMALLGFVLAVFIETMQWALRSGRITSADDVILNTAGLLMAAAISWPWWRRLNRCEQPDPKPERDVRTAASQNVKN